MGRPRCQSVGSSIQAGAHSAYRTAARHAAIVAPPSGSFCRVRELLDHGTWGIEVQVLCNLEWFYGHRYESRELAIAEAEDRKAGYLREGGILIA